jgi:hypothetical protein
MKPRRGRVPQERTVVRMSLCASHRLPTIIRHFPERRAIVIALRHLRRLRSRSGADRALSEIRYSWRNGTNRLKLGPDDLVALRRADRIIAVQHAA